MKKGLSVESKYDRAGNWMLIVKKERGKLTLEDVREVATEYDQDYYAIILKCMDEDVAQYWEDDLQGDVAEMYRATDFMKASGRTYESEVLNTVSLQDLLSKIPREIDVEIYQNDEREFVFIGTADCARKTLGQDILSRKVQRYECDIQGYNLIVDLADSV